MEIGRFDLEIDVQGLELVAEPEAQSGPIKYLI